MIFIDVNGSGLNSPPLESESEESIDADQMKLKIAE